MGILLKKRVSLICSTLRSRSLEYKQRLIDEVTISPVSVHMCMLSELSFSYFICAHLLISGLHAVLRTVSALIC